eukprot:TRINITY_DN80055_c0_g1_i1.p1 TRINITY_DN80055_c0_g1~~TRINITY_DN80055_c0_g1_i1.p1  ORF type:complete len:235 (+),score=81.63 TRINITY_DN80055_c0_g1_i1:158-862(+)
MNLRLGLIIALAFTNAYMSVVLISWGSWQNYHVEQTYTNTNAQTVNVKIDSNFDLNRLSWSDTAFFGTVNTNGNIWTLQNTMTYTAFDAANGTTCVAGLTLAFALSAVSALLSMLSGVLAFTASTNKSPAGAGFKILFAVVVLGAIGTQVFAEINYNQVNTTCFTKFQTAIQPTTLTGGDGLTYTKTATGPQVNFRQPAVSDFLTALVGLFGLAQIGISFSGPIQEIDYEKLEM